MQHYILPKNSPIKFLNINLVSIYDPNLVTQYNCIIDTESLSSLDIGNNEILLSFNDGGLIYAFITKKSYLVEIK